MASPATPAGARDSGLLPKYKNPPVHEVVLAVQFGEPLSSEGIEALREQLRDRFPASAGRVELQQLLEVAMGPVGQQVLRTSTQFDGWELKDNSDAPTRVARLTRLQISLHALRPGNWPSQEYPGWETIFEEFRECLRRIAPVYSAGKPRRVGLRYLNRIAVPSGTPLKEWFQLHLNHPSILEQDYTYNLRQTWARLRGYEDLSATIGLARIEVEDPVLKPNHDGAVLDIEVFNLAVAHAPSYDRLADWCERTHEAERTIFEGCITDALRERFEVIG
jgi:uncharacterized protein (TIGR04255 family)